jgi:hypothetical protein
MSAPCPNAGANNIRKAATRSLTLYRTFPLQQQFRIPDDLLYGVRLTRSLARLKASDAP